MVLGTPVTADNCGVKSVTNDAPTAFPLGETTVTWTVEDNSGNKATATQVVTVSDNVNPVWITSANSLDRSVDCGNTTALASAQALAPIASDNCSVTINKTPGVLSGNTYTNTWAATDASGNVSTLFTQVITVSPVTIDASASSVAIQLGTASVNLKATVLNANASPANGVTITFKVTNSSNTAVGEGAITIVNGLASLTIPIASLPIGLYKVEAVAGSNCSKSIAYMTIYDPNGNFITGGGWIVSPAGALLSNTTISGKANFGFNAKYQKGNNKVDGNTEFQFQAGDFNFKSNSLDEGTLVISGAKATYRGVGTVNGSGNYGFMVSAVDGDMNGGGGYDKFRIKIWDRSNGNKTVYDNNMGSDENGVPTTALGGGSIVIHENNSKKARLAADPVIVTEAAPEFNLRAYPNPSTSQFIVQIESSNRDEKIQVRVMDLNGREVELFKNLSANQTIKLGNNYRPGMYVVEMIQGNERKQLKLIKKPD